MSILFLLVLHNSKLYFCSYSMICKGYHVCMVTVSNFCHKIHILYFSLQTSPLFLLVLTDIHGIFVRLSDELRFHFFNAVQKVIHIYYYGYVFTYL